MSEHIVVIRPKNSQKKTQSVLFSDKNNDNLTNEFPNNWNWSSNDPRWWKSANLSGLCATSFEERETGRCLNWQRHWGTSMKSRRTEMRYFHPSFPFYPIQSILFSIFIRFIPFHPFLSIPSTFINCHKCFPILFTFSHPFKFHP